MASDLSTDAASSGGSRPARTAPLATRLFGLALAASLPFLALTGWLAYTLVDTRTREATEDLERSVEVTAKSIDRLVSRMRVLLRGLSQRELVRALDPTRCDPALAAVLRLNNDYTNVFTVDASGRRLCSAVAPPAGTSDYVDRSLYLDGSLGRRAFALSPPTLGQVSGKWAVYAVEPIIKDGAPAGIVGVGIDLATLSKVLDPRVLPMSGVATITDARGTIVARDPDARHWIGRDASTAPAVEAARSGRMGILRAHGPDGIDRFWAYRKVPQTDWLVFSGVAPEPILAGPKRLMWAILLTSCLLTLGVVWLSMRIARGIASPIRDVALAASRLGREDFVPPQVAGPAEALALKEALDASHSQRLAMERRLRDERSRLEGLVASAMDAVITVDSSCRIVLFNAAAERMFGLPAAEALYGPLDRLLPARFRAGHRGQVEGFARSGTTSRQMGALGTVRGVRANGEEFPIEASISQVKAGGERYLTAIVRDVSERVRAEAEVRDLAARLEQRVAQRTAELQATNSELQAYDYSISHDLRGPLGRIDGFARALQEDHAPRLDEQGRNYLGRIIATVSHMEQMVHDMLALSTLGRAEIERVPVDLTALAVDVVETLRRVDAGRRVSVEVAPGLRCDADAGLVRIVLENLIGNAWKFTAGREDARIEVGAHGPPDAPAYFVRDNGAGFDPRSAGRLFVPFRRLHTQEQFKGTGVGLATVRRIVHRHGGQIRAEGAIDGGATFFFTLGG